MPFGDPRGLEGAMSGGSTMGKVVQRAKGGGRHADRDPHDFWPTTQDCTVALMRFLRAEEPEALDFILREGIWEPACGDGAIGRPLEAMGLRVRATDLVDRGYGRGGVDFLRAGTPPERAIVTNPPFRLAEAFIRHASGLRRVCLTAFLLPSGYWYAGERVALYDFWRPSWILPLAWRPDMTGGGSGTMQLAWNVWIVWSRSSHSAGEGRLRPLPRPVYTQGGGMWA